LCESAMVLSHAALISMQPKVSAEAREGWESYAAQRDVPTGGSAPIPAADSANYFSTNRSVSNGIYQFTNGTAANSNNVGPFLFPVWQTSPTLWPVANDSGLVGILFDESSNPTRASAIQLMTDRKGSEMSAFLFQDTNESDLAYYSVPRSNLYYPIFDEQPGSIVGSINLQVLWENMLQGATLDHNKTIIAVLQGSCGGNFSYTIQGMEARFLGQGALYNTKLNAKMDVESSSYASFAALFDNHGMAPLDSNVSCSYRISSYATQEFKDVVRCVGYGFDFVF
jgi:hypothetical protein